MSNFYRNSIFAFLYYNKTMDKKKLDEINQLVVEKKFEEAKA